MDRLLPFILFLPFFGGFLLIFTPESFQNRYSLESFQKWLALTISLIVFFLSCWLWLLFDSSSQHFQFFFHFPWISGSNFSPCFAVDGISLFFILLTTFLVPLCLLASWDFPSSGPSRRIKEYFAHFLFIEGFVLLVFTSLDLLLFYIFFESVLIPMFILIGQWGSRERRVRAAYFFFLYTLLGSVLMLLAILFIYFQFGTTDYQILLSLPLTENKQYLLWLAFFASFAVKVPMLPFHIWLPEAHVEAPTAGSVILAGILLKLGTYGLIRFSLPLFPIASVYFTPLVYMMAIVAVIYTSFTAIRQSDMKRIIAYASVAHMNLTLLGLFSLTAPGIEGSILQMLSHGLVSGALFLCVGVLYDRHHSRMVKYYGGLTTTMPIFVTIFLFFTLANIGFPGTSSFVGEFMILLGVFQSNTLSAFFGGTGMILGGAYSLWLYNRIAYGTLKTEGIGYSLDLNRRELLIFFPLVLLTLLMGIFPEIFLETLRSSCAGINEHVLYFDSNLFLYFS